MRYENEICQGCGRIMHEGDDIVVCPECGTPQHRECYNAEKKCVNSHLHEDGFAWRAKHQEESSEDTSVVKSEEETLPCPFCHHENPVGAKECANCGQPFELFGKSIFPGGKKYYGGRADGEVYAYKPPFKVDEPEISENAYRAPLGDEEGEGFVFNGHQLRGEIDGVQNRDMALYLRTGVPRYHEKFRKIQNGKKTFNWAAFFLMPYWFFYRKLVKPGIIFMSLALLLSVLFYNPMNEYMNLMAEFASQMSRIENVQTTYQNGEPIPEEEQTNPDEIRAEMEGTLAKMQELMIPMTAYAMIYLLIRIIAGFVADGMYKKKAVADIREINDNLLGGINEQQEKYLAYTKKGGTSIGYAVLAYGAEYLISMVISGILTGMF